MKNPDEMLKDFKELPAMPNVIKHALDIIRQPESSTKDLAQIISYDQSLSTKILTLINSAYYGLPQQITSIVRATSLIGMSKTQNLIITVAMRPMFKNQGDKDLWRHSIATAVGCEYFAQKYRVIDMDEAFVIGFLHDIGKVVLKMQDSELYERVKTASAQNQSIIDAERLYFGIDHCLIGSFLAKKWQLPLLINNTVKYHHNPNLSSMPAASALVYLIDTLVKPDFQEENLNESFLKHLNIKIDDYGNLRENIIRKSLELLKELS